MNTKHARVVVTLILAIATLATMGFSADYEDNGAASIMPDHITCELIDPSLTAIEILEFIDAPCLSDLVERVETEIGWGLGGRLSTDVLLDSIYARSRSSGSGSVEYLELIETETDVRAAGPSVNSSARSVSRSEWSLNETDLAEIELDRGLGSASSPQALWDSIYERIRSTGSGSVEYLELLESETDSLASASVFSFAARDESPVGLGGPSASNFALVDIYTNAESSDVLNRPQDEPRAKFSGPSASNFVLVDIYTNAESSDVLNRPQDEPRAKFSGPSASNFALVDIYTNAESSDVLNRPQDEPRAK